MADAVTTQTLFSGSNKKVLLFTNISDGTGESAVSKIDISALTGAPTIIKINKVLYCVSGMAVKIIFDHNTDDTALVIQGDGKLDFTWCGGVPDPASAGGAGDVLFTTVGHTSGDSYSIVMEIAW